MIKGITADILLSVYLLLTLFLRITIEGALTTHPILSIFLGLVMLAFIWALIKTKVLQPNYFGLLGPKSKTESV